MSAGRVPADPPAKNIRCDAKDPARPRKYLEQNTFSKRGVQVEHDFGMVLMTNVGGRRADDALKALAAELYKSFGPEP